MAIKKNDNNQLFKGVVNVKAKGRLSEYPKAIKMMNSKLGHVFRYTPSSLLEIDSPIKMPSNDFFRDLVWQCNIVQSKKIVINTYIKLKDIYTEYVLNGELELALETLDVIEKKCGWSLWLIEANFFCKQQLFGLEGNKVFLQKIYTDRNISDNFDLIYYLSFLISERNEDGCHIGDLYQRVNNVIDNLSDKSFSRYLKNIINYIVFNDIDKSKPPEQITTSFSTLPIIDIYELLLRVFVEFKLELKLEQIKLPLKILSEINDKRIKRILSSYNLSIEGSWDEIYDFDYKKLVFPQLYRYLIMLGYDFKLEGLYIGEFHEAIISIVNQDERFEASYKFMLQFSTNLKHIDDIYSLLQIIKPFVSFSEVNTVKDLASIYGKVISNESIERYLEDNFSIVDFKSKINKIKELDVEQDNLDSGLQSTEIVVYNFSSYVNSHCSVLNFYSLMFEGKISEAFKLFVDLYIKNNNVNRVFSLLNFIKNKKWSFYRDLNSYVDTAIVLEAFSIFDYDEKQVFNLKACWRSFMNNVNLNRPSELSLEHFNGDLEKYLYFLEKICVAEVIGSDATNFQGERDIKIERISVCNKILEFELRLKILDERDSLERSIAIFDGLNELEIAGLTVDHERFKAVARKKFTNEFSRFKSFLELSINRQSHRNLEEKSSKIEHVLITKPLDEGDKILVNLIHDLSDMFLKNQEFGLDYYLSMRIRHGRLIGISRGPLERRKIVTKYSDIDQKYLDNSYWFDKYEPFLNFEELAILNKMLTDFSFKFDNLMKSFKDNQVQIRSDDKPNGLYFIEIYQSVLDLFKDTIKPETTIDVFLVEIVELFLLLVEKSSEKVKNWIDSKLKSEINKELYILQREVDSLIKRSTCNNLIVSEITSARTELNNTLNDISGWFDFSSENKTSIRTYSMEDVVEISLARTKRIYQEFNPKITRTESESIKGINFHSSLLALIVDALNIIFSNIYLHGNDFFPKIFINSKYISNSTKSVKINLNVSNLIDESLINYVRLDDIRNELASNQLKSHKEGGSGFHKLAAMPIVSETKDLDFGYKNGCFFVDLTLSLNVI